MNYVVYSFETDSIIRYFGFCPVSGDKYAIFPCMDENFYNDDINYWRERARGGPTLEERKAMKREEIAAARYESEIKGIEINGAKFATDRESQARITSVALQTLVNPKYACRWKTKDGFMIMNANQIKTVANAVREHVQACFDQEGVLAKQINESASFEELEEIKWDEKPTFDGGFADNTVIEWEYSTKN